jgi:hypothetical protein
VSISPGQQLCAFCERKAGYGAQASKRWRVGATVAGVVLLAGALAAAAAVAWKHSAHQVETRLAPEPARPGPLHPLRRLERVCPSGLARGGPDRVKNGLSLLSRGGRPLAVKGAVVSGRWREAELALLAKC